MNVSVAIAFFVTDHALIDGARPEDESNLDNKDFFA